MKGSGDERVVETSNGFILGHTVSAQGDVSVSVESPCFPESQLNRSMVWLETLTK